MQHFLLAASPLSVEPGHKDLQQVNRHRRKSNTFDIKLVSFQNQTIQIVNHMQEQYIVHTDIKVLRHYDWWYNSPVQDTINGWYKQAKQHWLNNEEPQPISPDFKIFHSWNMKINCQSRRLPLCWDKNQNFCC